MGSDWSQVSGSQQEIAVEYGKAKNLFFNRCPFTGGVCVYNHKSNTTRYAGIIGNGRIELED